MNKKVRFMKKIAFTLALVLVMTCVLAACAPKAQPSAGLPNPMVESDAAGILQKFGVEFGLPANAEDVKYFIVADQFAEVQFRQDDIAYTARIQSAAEFTDISGIAGGWDVEDDCSLFGGRGQAKSMRKASDGMTYDTILWYDVVPGLMYSITAKAADLDGYDLQPMAETVFIPTQGEVG